MWCGDQKLAWGGDLNSAPGQTTEEAELPGLECKRVWQWLAHIVLASFASILSSISPKREKRSKPREYLLCFSIYLTDGLPSQPEKVQRAPVVLGEGGRGLFPGGH